MNQKRKRKEHEKPERRNQGETINYFDYVPDEVLYEIMSMLPKIDLMNSLSKVSQRFQRVCDDTRLWESISFAKQVISLPQLDQLLSSSFPIKELNLTSTYMTSGDPRFRKHPIPNAQHRRDSDSSMLLERLDLTGFKNICQIDWLKRHWEGQRSDTIILSRCRTKALIMNVPRLPPDRELIDAISKHESLEVLSMEWSFFLHIVRVDDFQKLFNGCNRLKELNLTSCLLSTRQLRAVCDHIPKTVEKLVLVNIVLDDVQNSFREMEIPEQNTLAESYEALFRRAKNLRYFGVPFGHLRVPVIMDLLIQHQSLEALRFGGSDLRYLDFYIVLERVVPKLKKIDIYLGCQLGHLNWGRERILGELDEVRKAFIGIDIEAIEVPHETDDRF